ncbi:MAG: accessory factor UbiK family protein, partial [Sphingomonadaceae bacterium]|nr:accessory factor UbiK family protein [Sphingomonadaceae bacterium]
MQTENRFFDDLVKLLNGAAGTFAGMGREAENSMREKVREFVGGMEMVTRDEFEAVKAMAAAARDEAEALRARLDALEAGVRMGASSAS